MKKLLEVYDLNGTILGALGEAFDIQETLKMNAVNRLSFALPKSDPKNEYCQGLRLVSYGRDEKYYIASMKEDDTETAKTVYECEHILALLMEQPLPGAQVYGGKGLYTDDVIRFALSFQTGWILDRCDFQRQFEYLFEKESVLSALLKIPKEFSAKYMWATNTKSYPYKLSLIEIDTKQEPKVHIRKGFNRLKLENEIDYKRIYTRIYPYGAGERINQITIKPVNNGVEYLQSPPDIIAKYGIRSYQWIDRRYTIEESLRAAAQALLDDFQNPLSEYSVDYIDDCNIGDIVEIVGVNTSYVTEKTIKHDENSHPVYKLKNRTSTAATEIADIAAKQRTEMAYSQGATQIYTDSNSENGDANTPVDLLFFIPREMVFIDFVKVKVKMSRFRMYSTSTVAGGTMQTTEVGGKIQTSEVGGSIQASMEGGRLQTSKDGGSNATMASGGGYSDYSGSSTGAGGGAVATSEASDESTTHKIDVNGIPNLIPITGPEFQEGYTTESKTGAQVGTGTAHTHIYFETLWTHTHGMSHIHEVEIDEHEHEFEVSINIPEHTHGLQAVHAHEIDTRHDHKIDTRHAHEINTTHNHQINMIHEHGIAPIIAFAGNPTSVVLSVNNVQKQYFDGKDVELDITEFLKDENGNFRLGSWYTLSFLPNDKAYIYAAYTIQGYIQSV